MGELGFCHYQDIIGAIVGQIVSDTSKDGRLPLFLVRALHNKLSEGVFFSLSCYFQYFDFAKVVSFVSPFLLPFIIYAFWERRWRRGLVFLTILYPLVFIFFLKQLNIGTKINLAKTFFIFLATVGFFKAFLVVRARTS